MDLKSGRIFMYSLLVAPEKAVGYLIEAKEDEHIGIALVTLFLSILFNIFSGAIISLKKSVIDVYMSVGYFTSFFDFLGNLLVFLSIIFFVRSFSLSREQRVEFEKKNLAYIMFKLFCFSYIPYFFAPVLSVISLFLSEKAGSSYNGLFRLLLWFWTVLLQILVLKKVFNLKLISSFILYVLPAAAIMAFLFIKFLNWAVVLLTYL